MSDTELSEGTKDILHSFWNSVVDDDRECNPDVILLSLVKTHEGIGTDDDGVAIDNELKDTIESFSDDFGSTDSLDGDIYVDAMSPDESETDVYDVQY